MSCSKIKLWQYTVNLQQSFNDASLKVLHLWFITGFSDAEGTFIITITKNSKLYVGWKVKVMFKIGLDIKDYDLLQCIQGFFGVGKVTLDTKNNTCVFQVHVLKEIVEVILLHFNKYPLISNKGVGFFIVSRNCFIYV